MIANSPWRESLTVEPSTRDPIDLTNDNYTSAECHSLIEAHDDHPIDVECGTCLFTEIRCRPGVVVSQLLDRDGPASGFANVWAATRDELPV